MTTLAQARRALAGYTPTPADDSGASPAAVALILVEGDAGLEALFIRRAERADDPWSGQVAFPGGRRDTGDADLAATALRETIEETGVDLAGAERLAQLDDLRPRTPTLPPVFVRPFVYALSRRPSLSLSSEVHTAFWVPLARLRDRGARRDVTVTVRGGKLTVPAYVVDDYVIWGMTERILTSFLGLLPPSD